MNNEHDLYNSNRGWYDHLPERKYIILDFLPKCTGNTLNIGVHEFNKNDEVCCTKNCNYETLDIDTRCENFGSSYKHTTIDFLDYNPDYKFDNIILFGVLGIDDGCGGYRYTLHNNENKMIEHIDKVLKSGGKVLLGPDVNPSSCGTSYSTHEFWDNLIKTHEILKNYKCNVNYKGRNNLIIVLEK
tara:strand:- start:1143 stop:1700 length:558 start_codon:yes stop_codon:yes gene_type:complete